MKRNQKNRLYESIITSISKDIKKAINEAGNGHDLNTVGSFSGFTLDPNSSCSLRSYLNQIGKFPMLDTETEVELAHKYQEEGDKEALETLINSNLRFVVSIAKQYANRNNAISVEDLIHEGNIGLIEAAKNFNPEEPMRLTSYAVWYIRRNIIAAIEDTKDVKVPYNVSSLIRKIRKFQNNFEQTEQRLPTVDELAEKFDEDPKVIRQALKSMGRSTSIDEPSQFDDNESGTVGDTMSSNTYKRPGQDMEADDDSNQVRNIVTSIIKEKDPRNGDRNSEIFLSYYGFNGDNITVNDIADEFGLTTTMVNKIIRDTNDLIRKSNKFKKLRQYL